MKIKILTCIAMGIACAHVCYSSENSFKLLKQAALEYDKGNKASLQVFTDNEKDVSDAELSVIFRLLNLENNEKSVDFLNVMLARATTLKRKGAIITKYGKFSDPATKELASEALGRYLILQGSDVNVRVYIVQSLLNCGNASAIKILAGYCSSHPDAQKLILNLANLTGANLRNELLKVIPQISSDASPDIQNSMGASKITSPRLANPSEYIKVLEKLRGDQALSIADFQNLGVFASEPEVIEAIKKRCLSEKDAKTKGNLIAFLMQVCTRSDMLEILKASGRVDDEQTTKIIQAYQDGAIGPK